jgi:hypothetical protein
LKKSFVHFSAKVMANLYRSASRRHGVFAGSTVEKMLPMQSAFYQSELDQQQAGRERLLKRIRKFGS